MAADGTVEWWCTPQFDSPRVFASLLGSDRGDFCRPAPMSAATPPSASSTFPTLPSSLPDSWPRAGSAKSSTSCLPTPRRRRPPGTD
ncbi:hypothetical protein [Streptomyces sp. NPDC001381]|uniref:hypothetical protein n=1 Tax=Streptomyces sp. NPDC001381 TaxID=3364567 RepID=UPI00369C287E